MQGAVRGSPPKPDGGLPLVFKRGTTIHSDLDGISRIEFLESVEEKIIQIERELQVAELLRVT
jgi:hypothetical protein